LLVVDNDLTPVGGADLEQRCGTRRLLISPRGGRPGGPPWRRGRGARARRAAVRARRATAGDGVPRAALDRRGRAEQQLLCLLIEREGGDLAQVRLVRDQHDDAVDAWRQAAVGRRAVVQRPEHAAEALLEHVAAEGISPEQAVDDAISRIKQILSE
jgi:hypothetical protein